MRKVISLLLILVIIISACTNKESNDKIFVRAHGVPESLDLTKVSSGVSLYMNSNVFSGIYDVDGEGNLVFDGASDVSISEDKLTYTFDLKKDLKWVDNEGNEVGEVTANDYVFTAKRVLDVENQSPLLYLYQGVIKGADDYLTKGGDFDQVGITAIDDYTLEYTLALDAPYFQGMLAFPTFYPQPSGAYEKYGTDYASDAKFMWYNGPFYTNSFDPEYETKQLKNDSYWDSDVVELDGVTFRTIVEESTMKSAFKSGDIDYFETSDENLYNEGLDGSQVHDQLTAYTYFLSLNNDSERATADKDLREALYYGFDRESVVSAFSGEINKPIEYFMVAGITDITYGVEYRDYAQKSYGSFDKTRAQEALQRYMDKNDISKPSDISLEFLIDEGDAGTRTSVALQAAYSKDLGITITVNQLPTAQYRAKRTEGGFDIASGGWSGVYGDPSAYFDLYKSDNIGSVNAARYNSNQYDDLVDDATLITETDKRMQGFASAEEQLLSDYAIVPFYQKNNPYFIDEQFTKHWQSFLMISDKYTTYKEE